MSSTVVLKIIKDFKEFINIGMEMYTKAPGKMMSRKVLASCTLKTAKLIREALFKVKNMVKVFILGKMETDMLVISSMIKDRV
jgi:hypothetical protein